MISSVIARFPANSIEQPTIDEIAAHPSMEVGELVDGRLLPVTIEAENGNDMEELTRWLQTRRGVEFVDVVYVHYEDGGTDESTGSGTRGVVPVRHRTN